jgi:DNA-binding transcriptional LysR family regulator
MNRGSWWCLQEPSLRMSPTSAGCPSSASARAMARLRRATGTDQPPLHRYTATQSALSLVAAGQGIALIPMLALHGLPQDGVDTLDVPGLGTRRIVLRSYSRGKQIDALIAGVTALIRATVDAAEFQ